MRHNSRGEQCGRKALSDRADILAFRFAMSLGHWRHAMVSGLSAYSFEAIPAVHRLIVAREEWHLIFRAALGANDGMHFTWCPLATHRAAGRLPTPRPTGGTAAWLVQQTLLLIKFLLTRAEDELLAALSTSQRLVFVHDSGTSSKATLGTRDFAHTSLCANPFVSHAQHRKITIAVHGLVRMVEARIHDSPT